MVECWGEQNLTYGEDSDRGDKFTGVAVGRILCWDLMEEVFTWAAAGSEEYTHPQCLPDVEEGHECWTAGVDPPREIDDDVLESPILLPHSNSALYLDSDSS